jgi:hypothetical protein
VSFLGASGHRRHGVRGARHRARGEGSDGRGRARDHRLARVALALTFVFATALLAACGDDDTHALPRTSTARDETASYTSLDSPSLQFLPRGQEAPGWQLEQDPIVVPGKELVSYLAEDGAHFAHYDALDDTVGKYRTPDGNGFAVVEIFRFPDFVKAFGAYSTRKTDNSHLLNIPNEAFENKHSLHLWRGPFYVRVTGGGTPDGNQSLMRLLSSVADKMPAAPGKPAVFNFFPVNNRVVDSERYSAESGFGQAFLGNSFMASFVTPNKMRVDGLIIPTANKAAAAKILDAYKAVYIRNGKLLDPVPNLGEDNFTGEDKYMGRAVAFRIDRFVIAFNGFDDRQAIVDVASATEQRILGTIRKQLVTADNADENNGRSRNNANENVPAWAQRPR